MKDKTDSSRSDKQSPVLRGVLPALCVVLAVFAFAVQPPRSCSDGFWRILDLRCRDSSQTLRLPAARARRF